MSDVNNDDDEEVDNDEGVADVNKDANVKFLEGLLTGFGDHDAGAGFSRDRLFCDNVRFGFARLGYTSQIVIHHSTDNIHSIVIHLTIVAHHGVVIYHSMVLYRS